MEEHKRLLVKFRRLCGQTVVVNRGYFNPKTCVNYQEVLQNIFGIYPDEDIEICYQVLYTFICVIFYAYLKSVLGDVYTSFIC